MGSTGSVAGDILDNGTLTFDRNNLMVIPHPISGTGAIDQVGTGFTVLDAVNPVSGLTTISAGTLEVGDASHAGAELGGNVIVAAGGTLMGHGTIVGSVVNNGVVAPGGTIGTLTVGSYAQGPGGTLAIEVSPAAASQLNSLGAASLNGRLALAFDPGTYDADIYDILNGHPVSGTFSSVTSTGSVGPGNVFGIFYAPTQVDLVTEATANAQVYGGVSAATLDRAQNFATLVEDRFGDAGCPDGSVDKTAADCGGFGAWAFAIGSWNRLSGSGANFGFTNDGVGVIGGIDRSWENGSMVGGAFGYAHNDLNMTAGAGKADGPSYYGAVYGRLVDRGVWWDGEVFYMHTNWSVDRTVPGIGLATASPNTDSEGFLLQGSLPIGTPACGPTPASPTCSPTAARWPRTASVRWASGSNPTSRARRWARSGCFTSAPSRLPAAWRSGPRSRSACRTMPASTARRSPATSPVCRTPPSTRWARASGASPASSTAR